MESKKAHTKEIVTVDVQEIVSEFKLPNKKILVRFIKVQKGNVTNPKHVAYGGKLEGSFDALPPKKLGNGSFVNVLSELERVELERMLFMESGSLSPYRKENNYFASMNDIILRKEGTHLDLSNPIEYIQYKILLSYDDFISPSITETSNKKTYRYELVSTGDDDAVSKKFTDYKRKAYKILDNIENNRDKLAMAIRLSSNKKVSTESDHEWLIGQVSAEIEKNAKRFCEIMSDENIETKYFLKQAIDAKAVVEAKGIYKTIDGIELCYDGAIATLDNAIAFINDIKNQDIKLLIKSKIK